MQRIRHGQAPQAFQEPRHPEKHRTHFQIRGEVPHEQTPDIEPTPFQERLRESPHIGVPCEVAPSETTADSHGKARRRRRRVHINPHKLRCNPQIL